MGFTIPELVYQKKIKAVERDIAIIVAMSENNVIGKDGEIPWPHIPKDMGHFQKTTAGHTVVVGRKTDVAILKKLGFALPNRDMVVITRHPRLVLPRPRCLVLSDNPVKRVLAMARTKKVFVAGGGEIYKLFFDHVNRLIVTHIHLKVDGDTLFPEIPAKDWNLENAVPYEATGSHPKFSIARYVRVKPRG